ncbi:MAG: hypothetical protein LC620_03180, partial [Halobacteriales archaeon]|nr:hypothetical protein [Halobacteriales archaeon]
MPHTALARTALLALLACCHAAVAQPGPAPGQDPVSHATGYAQDQVAQAAADPAGYAQRTATVPGVANVTSEAGYVACWAAYDAGEPLDPVCAGFFTPPGKAARPNDEDNATAGAAELASDALNRTSGLANATVDA